MLIFSISGSFTELYVNSLLHLVDHIDDMDEEHMKFLPDLQITETSCNKKDLGKKQFILHIISTMFEYRTLYFHLACFLGRIKYRPFGLNVILQENMLDECTKYLLMPVEVCTVIS